MCFSSRKKAPSTFRSSLSVRSTKGLAQNKGKGKLSLLIPHTIPVSVTIIAAEFARDTTILLESHVMEIMAEPIVYVNGKRHVLPLGAGENTLLQYLRGIYQ